MREAAVVCRRDENSRRSAEHTYLECMGMDGLLEDWWVSWEFPPFLRRGQDG